MNNNITLIIIVFLSILSTIVHLSTVVLYCSWYNFECQGAIIRLIISVIILIISVYLLISSKKTKPNLVLKQLKIHKRVYSATIVILLLIILLLISIPIIKVLIFRFSAPIDVEFISENKKIKQITYFKSIPKYYQIAAEVQIKTEKKTSQIFCKLTILANRPLKYPLTVIITVFQSNELPNAVFNFSEIKSLNNGESIQLTSQQESKLSLNENSSMTIEVHSKKLLTW